MMQINDNLYIHHISLNTKATSQFKHMIVRYTIGSGPEAERKKKARLKRVRVGFVSSPRALEYACRIPCSSEVADDHEY